MSNRRAKRERHEMISRNRLRYLLAVMSLEELQRCGVVSKDATTKPNFTAIELMISERLNTFRKADTRLRKKTSPDWVARLPDKKWTALGSEIKGQEVTTVFLDELHEIPT